MEERIAAYVNKRPSFQDGLKSISVKEIQAIKKSVKEEYAAFENPARQYRPLE